MITPDEIRRKAERLYSKVVQAWLDDAQMFPHVLRSSKHLADDIVENIAAVQTLRNGSKDVLGFGYSIDWVERRMRASGRNEVPERIWFETRDDLLQLIDRHREFAAMQSAVTVIRQQLPQLETWVRTHTKQLMAVTNEIDGLIGVTQWFRLNPRPNCFSRELPVHVDTKFIERHQKTLQQWFDTDGVLPPGAIRADEQQFERRYGLRDKEPLLLVRCLDLQLQRSLGFPCAELALPLGVLAKLDAPAMRVFVVENRMNVRTFPATPNAIVLEGRGYAVSDLRDLEWLNHCDLIYWGDIDVDGLQILSQFRRLFPTVRSLMMDTQTLTQLVHLTRTSNGKCPEAPELLTDLETAVFEKCAADNVRLEQERVPQSFIRTAVGRLNQ